MIYIILLSYVLLRILSKVWNFHFFFFIRAKQLAPYPCFFFKILILWYKIRYKQNHVFIIFIICWNNNIRMRICFINPSIFQLFHWRWNENVVNIFISQIVSNFGFSSYSITLIMHSWNANELIRLMVDWIIILFRSRHQKIRTS